MLHAAVDVVVETEDLAVVVTTVILEAVMVTVEDTISPLRKGGGVQSLSMRNVVYLVCMAVLLAVVDVVKLVKVNVLEGHTSVVVELAEGLS